MVSLIPRNLPKKAIEWTVHAVIVSLVGGIFGAFYEAFDRLGKLERKLDRIELQIASHGLEMVNKAKVDLDSHGKN